MGYFFDFSESFLNTLGYLGDVLLYTPFSDVENIVNSYLGEQIPGWLMSFISEVLPDLTIGQMLFGSFLTFILVWKIICFFTDIAT